MISAEIILTLDQIPGLGPRKVRALINALSDVDSWADLLSRDLKKIDGISGTLVERIRGAETELPAKILDQCAALETRYIYLGHPEYPGLLAELYDAPVGLFVRGKGALDADYLAVVGTRRASDYGREQTRQLTFGMVAAGLGIISGMARGIDTYAHKAALEAGGQTVTILGCGVDVVYPSENRKLYEQILEQGLAISEYPPGTKPEGHHFPQRNRIISGLALGTLVVEAGAGSGAIITALRSLDQDREVFAVPGRINDSRSEGCHNLIQQGAKLVTKLEDILSELQQPYSAGPGVQLDLLRDLPDPEREIIEYLDGDPVQVDRIAEDLGQNISSLLSLLVTMELRGIVVQTAGKRFSRA